MTAPVEAAIFSLLAEREPGKSVSPHRSPFLTGLGGDTATTGD